MKSHRCLSLVVAFLVFVVACAPSTVAQDTVRLAVSAAAQGGASVTDLTKADFAVKDSGKPRTLANFTAPKPNPTASQKLQPNEFSNYPDPREANGAIFVVLDIIHTRFVDERDVRVQILKFMASAAQAKHAVSLAILSEKGTARLSRLPHRLRRSTSCAGENRPWRHEGRHRSSGRKRKRCQRGSGSAHGVQQE